MRSYQLNLSVGAGLWLVMVLVSFWQMGNPAAAISPMPLLPTSAILDNWESGVGKWFFIGSWIVLDVGFISLALVALYRKSLRLSTSWLALSAVWLCLSFYALYRVNVVFDAMFAHAFGGR
jgi:hypothetical protein